MSNYETSPDLTNAYTIYFDGQHGYKGIDWPIGSDKYPVNNHEDAQAIADKLYEACKKRKQGCTIQLIEVGTDFVIATWMSTVELQYRGIDELDNDTE